MKALVLALGGIAVCIAANGESLTTIDGKTYEGITSQRVDPDGLYVEYTPPGGGVGMAKVKFARLSADQQKQFGYDPEKAKSYEAGEAKAAEAWRAESTRLEQAAEAQRRAQEAQDIERERVENDRMIATAQLMQAQAAAAGEAEQSMATPYGGGYGWSLGGGYAVVAVPGAGPSLDGVNQPINGKFNPAKFPPEPFTHLPNRPAFSGKHGGAGSPSGGHVQFGRK